MKTHFVADLLKMKHGGTFQSQFRLLFPQLLVAKNGNPYLQFRLADRTGEIDGKWWQCREEHFAEARSAAYLWIAGSVEIYKDKRQVIAQAPPAWLSEPEDPAHFVTVAPLPLAELRCRLDAHIASVTSHPLQALLRTVFAEGGLRNRFETAPAAQKRHHVCRHGLLQHTIEVTDLAAAMVDAQARWGYAALCRDLVVAGALLHDIGKVLELTWTEDGAYGASRRGQFLNHTFIGVQLLVEKMKGIPGLTEDHKDAILHIIAAHHGKMDFGAAATPKFAEALIVHMADDSSVKLFYMDEAVAAADSEFVKVYKLDNQIIYGRRFADMETFAETDGVPEAAPVMAPISVAAPPLPAAGSLPILRFRTSADAASENISFHTRPITLVGRAAAGAPIYADAHSGGTYEVEDEALRAGEQYCLLRIKGDSMTGDGIQDGDLVVYHAQDAVEPEDIAVVCVDEDDAAIKRVRRTLDGIELLSSNPETTPMTIADPSTLHIWGRVVGIARN